MIRVYSRYRKEWLRYEITLAYEEVGRTERITFSVEEDIPMEDFCKLIEEAINSLADLV